MAYLRPSWWPDGSRSNLRREGGFRPAYRAVPTPVEPERSHENRSHPTSTERAEIASPKPRRAPKPGVVHWWVRALRAPSGPSWAGSPTALVRAPDGRGPAPTAGAGPVLGLGHPSRLSTGAGPVSRSRHRSRSRGTCPVDYPRFEVSVRTCSSYGPAVIARSGLTTPNTFRTPTFAVGVWPGWNGARSPDSPRLLIWSRNPRRPG